MHPHLDIRHLQMLAALAESGSVAEAAHALGVTPSALSHRIREAERRLDLTLIEKAGRGVRLTPGGVSLAEDGARILDALFRAESDAASIGRGIENVVRLGVGYYSSFHWLPGFLSHLAEIHPTIDVQIVANAAQRPIDSLLEGETDIVVMPDMPMVGGVWRCRLFDDDLVVVMSPEHDLAGRDFVTARDLAEETVLTYSFTTLPGHEGDRFWRAAKVSPRRMVRVEIIEAIVELIRAGFGTAILAQWAMKPYVDAGMLAASGLGRNGVSVAWNAVLRTQSRDGGAAETVAAMLAEWCDTHGGLDG